MENIEEYRKLLKVVTESMQAKTELFKKLDLDIEKFNLNDKKKEHLLSHINDLIKRTDEEKGIVKCIFQSLLSEL